MRVWINLYRQGYYYRVGTSDTMNFHAGPFVYPSEAKAKADIDQRAPYLATVPLDIPDIPGFRPAEFLDTYLPPAQLAASREKLRLDGDATTLRPHVYLDQLTSTRVHKGLDQHVYRVTEDRGVARPYTPGVEKLIEARKQLEAGAGSVTVVTGTTQIVYTQEDLPALRQKILYSM